MKSCLYLLILFATSMLGACQQDLHRGYDSSRSRVFIDSGKDIMQDIHLIKQEMSKTEVLRLLGSPTLLSYFDQDTWYYITLYTKIPGIIFKHPTYNSHSVRIQFKNDEVSDIHHITVSTQEMPEILEKTQSTATHSASLPEKLLRGLKAAGIKPI